MTKYEAKVLAAGLSAKETLQEISDILETWRNDAEIKHFSTLSEVMEAMDESGYTALTQLCELYPSDFDADVSDD